MTANDSKKSYIDELGTLDDDAIDLAKAALAISSEESPSLNMNRYETHIQSLIDDVAARHQELLKHGAEDNAETQLASLKHVIHDENEYSGDDKNYDDLQNMSLVRVIERRKGIPAALALIYVHVAQAQGWSLVALKFPAHVVCRIEMGATRLIFDPFDTCKLMGASDLRGLLKRLVSDTAELSTDYYEASSNRELLIRLQNNKKLRQIECEDYEASLETILILRRIDPSEYRLLLDAGVLFARTNRLKDAVGALESYIDLAPKDADIYDAELLLREIKENMN